MKDELKGPMSYDYSKPVKADDIIASKRWQKEQRRKLDEMEKKSKKSH